MTVKLSARERVALERERSALIQLLATVARDGGARGSGCAGPQRDRLAARVRQIGEALSPGSTTE